ncbi:DUF1489 family protein [Acidimangrovimonas pyrenivorans]|uniref:DUF1489 family protein n=1 Tax=Acidimangrovimonas pyrenivorans TaxID=2030798 RepID=A0ABV7ALU6_9RHOB
MADFVNLIKLCVGADRVEDMEAWQAARRGERPDYVPEHVTRMWPKREAELLNGGSLYWVFKGVIGARQRVVGLEERIGQDGIRRCALILDPQIVRTEGAPRRPFQGWRYLAPEDAPRDLAAPREGEDSLPPGMAEALAEFGVR